MTVPKSHPRYESLVRRDRLAEMVERGLVTPTGLVSHGRGEAFDYLMGEKTLPVSMEAERVAVAYLLTAKNPVVCVNGNAAALDAENLIHLAKATGSKIEVNIFHRTEERMTLLIDHMKASGAENVLGAEPDARIPGLDSDRALCTKEGIFSSDVILVPIEDGDRAEALVAMGKVVISIDLNPLSRTSKTATVPISDEILRATKNMIEIAESMRGNMEEARRAISSYSADESRKAVMKAIIDALSESM